MVYPKKTYLKVLLRNAYARPATAGHCWPWPAKAGQGRSGALILDFPAPGDLGVAPLSFLCNGYEVDTAICVARMQMACTASRTVQNMTITQACQKNVQHTPAHCPTGKTQGGVTQWKLFGTMHRRVMQARQLGLQYNIVRAGHAQMI